MVFIGLWRHEGLDKADVAFNTFADDLFSDNGVKENVKLNDHFFQMVRFVGLLFSDEESVIFFQNVLDFTDDMRPPDNLPVFFRVKGFFVQPLLESIQQVSRVVVRNRA
jgi:hypothetical protein